MRLIKGFIVAMAGLFIMITLVSLLIPSKVMVSRGVVVNAPAAKVFAAIGNLHQWKKWQPVFKSDSSGVQFGNDSTVVGSYCEWVTAGKKNKFVFTAKAEMQLTAALQREGENDVMNMISVLPLADSNKVQVEWKALTKLKWYPWEKFYGIFIEKMTGPGYDDALNSLKAYIENNQ